MRPFACGPSPASGQVRANPSKTQGTDGRWLGFTGVRPEEAELLIRFSQALQGQSFASAGPAALPGPHRPSAPSWARQVEWGWTGGGKDGRERMWAEVAGGETGQVGTGQVTHVQAACRRKDPQQIHPGV